MTDAEILSAIMSAVRELTLDRSPLIGPDASLPSPGSAAEPVRNLLLALVERRLNCRLDENETRGLQDIGDLARYVTGVSPLTDAAPGGRCLLDLQSPGFVVHRPEVVGEELIPDRYRQALQHVWSIGDVPSGPVRISVLHDAVVADEGLVFQSNLEIWPPSQRGFPAGRVEAARNAVQRARANGTLRTLPGMTFLCERISTFIYGHWLCEMLPWAVLARRHLRGIPLSYLVHTSKPSMRPVMRETLLLAGVAPSRLVWTDGAPLRAENLILVDGMTRHGEYMSPLVLSCLDELTRHIPAGEERLIYVTRGGADHRRLANEEALLRVARAKGYVSYEPTGRSFVEQVSIFKGARRVVGVLGSGLANIAFSPSGTRIRLLVPYEAPDTFFWFLAQHRGLEYREYRCQYASPSTTGTPWDADIQLAPELFAEILER